MRGVECKGGRRRGEEARTGGDVGEWAEGAVNTRTESKSADNLGALPRILTRDRNVK